MALTSTSTLSLKEYDLALLEAFVEHPEWRKGQTMFNVLYDLAPELADEVRGGELDPFYNDNIAPFCQFLCDRLS